MDPTTRTFLAVSLPDATRTELGRVRDELRGDLSGLRWVAPELFHLTLAFLGDLPTEDLDRLSTSVAEAVEPVTVFALEVIGLGAFPKPEKARVLWAGVVGEDLSRLDTLRRLVVRATIDAGHPPTDDRFHPHITLGRSRTARESTTDLRAILDRQQSRPFGTLPVRSVELMASTLTPEGPIYRPLHSLPMDRGSA